MLKYQTIPVTPFQQNCSLVWDSETKQAAVIDPGGDLETLLGQAQRLGLKLEQIWLTHAHIDHIWGVDDVRAATGAPVWLHPLDRRWYDILPEQGRMFGLDGLPRLAPPDHELAHGQTLSVGRFDFAVRHVPGHAPGHVAFIGHGLAVSGDVLFAGSIGRTDLAGGDLSRLLQSIRDELLTLPDATRVLPGHGPETTVGAERAANPFLR